MKPTKLQIQPRSASAQRPPGHSVEGKEESPAGRKVSTRKSITSKPSRRKATTIALLFSVSCVAIGWSFGQLAPMNQRQEALNREVSQVTDSISRLEFSIHPADTQKVEEDYSLAIQSLFDESTGFPSWREAIQSKAAELGLQVTAYLGTMQTQTVANSHVRILPATLEIEPLADPSGTPQTVFQRLLLFNQHVLESGRRMDFLDMRVTAGTNAIERVEATLNLWFQSEGNS